MIKLKSKENTLKVMILSMTHGINHAYIVFFTPILPIIASHFQINYAKLGAMVSGAYITYGLIAFPSGIIIDKFDHKKLIIFSVIIPAIFCLIGGIANSFWIMVIALMGIGVGAGFYHPSSMAYLSLMTNKKNRGKIFGIHGIGGNIGMMIAPMLSGFIATIYNWHGVFWLWSIIGICLTLVLFKKLSSVKKVISETKKKKVSLKVFLKSSFILGIAIVMTHGMIYQGLFAFIPTYLKEIRGFSLTIAGGITGIYFAAGIVGQMIGGSLTDKYGSKKTLLFTSILLVLTLFLIPTIDTIIILIINLIFNGMFIFAVQPPISSYIASLMPAKIQGKSFGMYFGFQYSTGAIAPLIGGIIANKYGFSHFFFALTGVAVVGLIMVFYLRESNVERSNSKRQR